VDTLYDKYGGFDTFNIVVSRFYQKVLNSEELAPYFENVDMENLIVHQTNFIATALGGPEQYSGIDLKTVHAPFNITIPHFHEITELLEESLDEASVDPKDIATIIDLISEMMDQIVSPD